MSTPFSDLTHMLDAAHSGNSEAAERILPLVYEELRKLASSKMAREATEQTLQPTALVHEAWIRLTGGAGTSFQGRAHFFAAAAEAMRRILIDRARRKRAERHGGRCEHIDVTQIDLAVADSDDQLLAVHEALDLFAIEHPKPAELIKLRYFAGMTIKEASLVLSISQDTAKDYSAFARAWLFRELTKSRS